LDRQARRDRRRPCLEAALLSRSLWPYILYRLQYFALRLAARLAVHVVSFAFMYRVFSPPALVAAGAGHAAAASSPRVSLGARRTRLPPRRRASGGARSKRCARASGRCTATVSRVASPARSPGGSRSR